MTLKDDIKKDIQNVFMNEEEFAEQHEFDGDLVTCIVDDDLLKQNKLKSETYKGTKMIHVPKCQLKGVPIPYGDFVTFDGRSYTVTDVDNNAGMVTITLDTNRSL